MAILLGAFDPTEDLNSYGLFRIAQTGSADISKASLLFLMFNQSIRLLFSVDCRVFRLGVSTNTSI